MAGELPEHLKRMQEQVEAVARGYGLDYYPVIFEMLDYDEINAVAAFGGFPSRYPHWRFGMEYDQLSKSYTYGMSKIYEMVINNDPCYAYLMKSNSDVDQKLVMAHVYAHCDFFKCNHWFSKTNRKMMDTMANHGMRIRTYIDRFGIDRVESFIDRCLSIEDLIDPHQPFVKPAQSPKKGTGEEPPREEAIHKLKSDRSYMDNYINPKEFVDKLKDDQKKKKKEQQKSSKEFARRDILKYLLDHAPLTNWQADILTMIRDESYYYVPQGQTKIMNEGWAAYWHSTMMTRNLLKDSEIIDFADHHSGTTAMAKGRMNPYKIGLEVFRDIEERWNKGQFGKEYHECDDIIEKQRWDKKLGLGREKIFEVRRVYNDITFLDEYLTEEVAIRLQLFTFNYNKRSNQYEIESREFRKVKEKILFQLTNYGRPFIEVADGNYKNRGELLLHHKHMGIDLDPHYARETLKNMSEIWRRPVNIETLVEGNRKVLAWHPQEGFSEHD